MNRKPFDQCEHNWEFQIDVGRAGGPAAGNTVFICKKCGNEITLKEKAALDTVSTTEKSLKNQEHSLENAKIATYIAAGALCLSALVFIIDKFI